MQTIFILSSTTGGLIGVAGFVVIFFGCAYYFLLQSDRMIREEFGEEAVKNSSAL